MEFIITVAIVLVVLGSVSSIVGFKNITYGTKIRRISMENEMMKGQESPELVQPHYLMTRKTKRLIFYICMIALFVVETIVFYIYVNASSFVLAFQEYENTLSGYVPHWAGFDNFKTIIEVIKAPSNAGMIKWSLLMYCVHVCITMASALFLSFYIYIRIKPENVT